MNFAKVCGERGGIDSKITEDWKVKLPDILSGYDDKNIFNLDKSGLFFLPPHDNLLSIKGKQCTEGKCSKDMITVSLCVTVLSEFDRPLVIGKSAKLQF